MTIPSKGGFMIVTKEIEICECVRRMCTVSECLDCPDCEGRGWRIKERGEK